MRIRTVQNREPQKHAKRTNDQTADGKASLAFEGADAAGARSREVGDRPAEGARATQRAVDKAQSAIDAARRKHEKDTADIRAQLQALEERAQAEEARWEKERVRLETALRRARG